jgi:protocatechuate 3,4-dioxygenase beta subunit
LTFQYADIFLILPVQQLYLNLRGKITTDKDGKYVLDTIYPGALHIGTTAIRPSHIHVMVAVPGQLILTTQVYFEGQPRDAAVKDPLITKTVTDANGIRIANFVAYNKPQTVNQTVGEPLNAPNQENHL